jgi:hypothetical protein
MDGFKDFIEADASYQGVQRFGQPQNPTHARRPNYTTQAYNQSIQRGHQSERDIEQGMQTSCGFTLMASPSQIQDMRQAIDTFILKDGRKIPVQIKARKFGTMAGNDMANDIGYEVAKDFNANDPHGRPPTEQLLSRLNGRDMRGMAQLTVVLDQRGDKLYMIDTNEGHGIIQKVVAEWLQVLKQFATHPTVKARYEGKYGSNGVELVTKFDTRDNYWKVMAYIKPQSFKSLQMCALNKKIDTRFDY